MPSVVRRLKSKVLAFEEGVAAFEDESQARPIYTIKADRAAAHDQEARPARDGLPIEQQT